MSLTIFVILFIFGVILNILAIYKSYHVLAFLLLANQKEKISDENKGYLKEMINELKREDIFSTQLKYIISVLIFISFVGYFYNYISYYDKLIMCFSLNIVIQISYYFLVIQLTNKENKETN